MFNRTKNEMKCKLKSFQPNETIKKKLQKKQKKAHAQA